ncbi:WD40 repeat-like protein [Myriangium duriaei CBS 260.36]|uniref:WD40 repeat-like protein n=1 Tax=Myriangium duriaei CBS 260.36 TaxID=1168546 RepID=A0A9P4MQY0_9PEZI|nr:WD40 repeat-like protein [Myriangium duriaei CBS 260.36]
MPAPTRSRPLKKEYLPSAFRSIKPVLFSETARPSTLAPSIRHIAWSPLGSCLASTSGATIRIWNPEKPTVKASQELRGHVGAVERVAWRPGREAELASTGVDGTVRLWDVRVGAAGQGKSTCVAEVKAGQHGLFLTWSPDGTEVVVGTRDDVIVPIDVRMGAAVGSVPEALEAREGKKLQTAQTNQLAFSNSGREVFATTGDGLVKVLDWPSMEHLHTLNAHTSAANCVAHSPNGNYLATGGSDSLIALWDTHDWVCRHTLARSTSAIHHLSFSFDGTYLASGCGSEKDGQSGIEIAHVETGEYVHTIETTNAPTIVAWHPLRYWLAYAGDAGGLRTIGVGNNAL